MTSEAGARGTSRAMTWVPLVTVWIVWGTTYLGSSVIGDTMPPLLGNGSRLFVAAGLLALGMRMFAGRASVRVTRSQLRSLAMLGVMTLGVSVGVTTLAVRVLPSGIAALLVSVNSLFIVLLRAACGDRPARLTWIGVGVGLTGLALMLLPGGTALRSGTESDALVWSLALLAGTFSWSYFSFRSAGFGLPSNPLTITLYEMAAAGAALIVAGIVVGEHWEFATVSTRSWTAWGWLVAVSLIGYLSFITVLGRAPVSLVMTYGYVNPVIAVLLGWLLNAEDLTTDVFVGLTIVLGGVVLVVSGERGGSSGESIR